MWRIGEAGYTTIASHVFAAQADGSALNLWNTTAQDAVRFNLSVHNYTASAYYVLRAAAGVSVGSYTLRSNGAARGIGSYFGNSANPMALTNQYTAIGGGNGPAASSYRDVSGDCNCFMLFNADLTGTDLTAIETELALHQ
jgi:hypothetical protein